MFFKVRNSSIAAARQEQQPIRRRGVELHAAPRIEVVDAAPVAQAEGPAMAEALAGASQREDVAFRPATYVGREAGVQHRGPAACEGCDASFLHIHSQEQQARQDNEGEGRADNPEGISPMALRLPLPAAAFGQLPDRRLDVAVQLLGQSVYLHLLRLLRRKRVG